MTRRKGWIVAHARLRLASRSSPRIAASDESSRGEPRWFIACQSCGEEVDVKAKGGDKVRKELDTKGDKAGIKKRPGYVWAKARPEVVTKNTRLTRLPAGVVTGLIGNHAVYTMLGHHQCLVLV